MSGIPVSIKAARKAKQARLKRDLRLWEVAAAANVCQSYISYIECERGSRSASPVVLANLAQALEINPRVFCEGCPIHQAQTRKEA